MEIETLQNGHFQFSVSFIDSYFISALPFTE